MMRNLFRNRSTIIIFFYILLVPIFGMSSCDGSSDSVSPEIIFTSPTIDSTDIGINTNISVIFSEEMDVKTLTGENIQIKTASTPVSGTIQYDKNIAVFDPDNPLEYGTTYTATLLANISDLSGNSLPKNYTFSFTTDANPAPEIEVRQDLSMLIDGTSNFNAGEVITGTTDTTTFTVKNSGSETLDIFNVAIASGDTDLFALDISSMKTTLEPDEITSFVLSFNPIETGDKEIEIIVTSNDADEADFSYTVLASVIPVPPQDIAVKDSTTDLTSGSSTISFPQVTTGDPAEMKTITIENNGFEELVIASVTLDSGDVSDFSVDTASMDMSLARGESTEFILCYLPGSAGIKAAEILISCNDADESEFTFSATGTAIGPNLVLSNSPTGDIVDGGTLTLDDTYEGAINSHGIVLRNDGTTDLTITDIQETSGDTDQFSINFTNSGAIGSSEEDTLTIDFFPTSPGSKSMVLTVCSDDPVTPEYAITITGNALAWESGWRNVFLSNTDINKGRSNSIAVAPDGTIYIASYDNLDRVPYVSKSVDGGKFWTHTIIDSGGTCYSCDIKVGSSGKVFVLYNYSGTIKLAYSTDGGDTYFSSTINNGGSNCSLYVGTDETVYASYGSENSDLLFSKQTITGDWVTMVVDSSIGFNVSCGTSLTGKSTGELIITYFDNVDDDLMAAISTDGGANWTKSEVDTIGNVGEWSKCAVDSDDNVYAMYYSRTDNIIKMAMLPDGNTLWTKSIIKNITSEGRLDLAVDGNNYLYFINQDNEDISINISLNQGLTWTNSTIRTIGSTVTGVSVEKGPGSNIYVSFTNSTSLNNVWLEFIKSTDNGLSW